MAEPGRIDPQVVTRLIYGYHDRQRFTQDTPILLEVWQRFAGAPGGRHDVLITPFKSKSVLALLRHLFTPADAESRVQTRYAPLQSFLAAHLSFGELVSLILPLTDWAAKAWIRFRDHWIDDFEASAFDQAYRSALTPEGLALVAKDLPATDVVLRGTLLDAARVITLTAVIDLARDGTVGRIDIVEDLAAYRDQIIGRMRSLMSGLMDAIKEGSTDPWVWRVSNNRAISLADTESRATVKGDAAVRVFDVKCDSITWAVVDSGIDAGHVAFRVDPGNAASGSRVVATYDFGPLRALLDPAYSPTFGGKPGDNPALAVVARSAGLTHRAAKEHLTAVYRSYDTDMLDWSSIEPLLKVEQPDVPTDGHGTHVAGIIGADWRDPVEPLQGLCPDIRLYDLRIISDTLENTEFAVIAALQLVRYLNSHNQYVVVHGVNLSLAIPQAIESYGCGHTPVCDEAERLVNSGVAVVAAAGNAGYQKYLTERGTYEGFASASITDPGNADAVITVGSTHKRDPHTYGVSYFSSRGPTGDGRMKPDLVAPGERIESTLPGGERGSLDGTSQAAPHVSAAAAMLMARYPELIREPRRIKQLLCDTATDLGRERSFQGRGLLDILRALESF